MNRQDESPELKGSRKRAAEIRQHWSPSERQKRAGLPPDTPWALLRTFLAPSTRSALVHGDLKWQTAPISAHR
jgi:hypothetical protein